MAGVSSFVKVYGTNTTISNLTFTDFHLTTKIGRGHLSGDEIVSNRVKVSQAGYYLVTAHTQYNNNSNGYRYARILLDGVEQARGVNSAIANDVPTTSEVTMLISVGAGQTIGMDGYQSSGTDLIMMTEGCYLCITKLE